MKPDISRARLNVMVAQMQVAVALICGTDEERAVAKAALDGAARTLGALQKQALMNTE